MGRSSGRKKGRRGARGGKEKKYFIMGRGERKRTEVVRKEDGKYWEQKRDTELRKERKPLIRREE